MKLSSKMCSILLSLFLFGFLSVNMLIAASNTQWFPDENTVIEYNLKCYITLNNGKRVPSTTFDIYNFSDTTAYVIPSYWKHIDDRIYPSFVNYSMINNTNVVFRRIYSDESVTHISRKGAFFFNGTNLGYKTLYLSLKISESTWGAILLHSGDYGESIERESFNYGVLDFPDYMDITRGPGYGLGIYRYAGETADTISFYADLNVDYSNKTIITDKSGRVLSFTYNYEVDDVSFPEVISTSYICYREGTPPSISAEPNVQYTPDTLGNWINWTVSDETAMNYSLYINGQLNKSGTLNNGVFKVNVDNMTAGVYEYKLMVSDANGNTNSDIVLVIVNSQSQIPAFNEIQLLFASIAGFVVCIWKIKSKNGIKILN